MLFDRLLSRRRPAVPKTTSQADLAEIALGHGDTALRLDAVRRLASLAHLRQILGTDSEAAVRELALGRYRNLLCGVEESGAQLTERLAEIAWVEDPRILEHLAQAGREPEARLAAIERVSDPSVLLQCVLHDPRAANRAAALARLQDRGSLEQVARRIGKKDTGIYREARERLRRLAEQEEQPRRLQAQCAELCERAEGLGRLERWGPDRALLDHLDRQWAQVQSQAEGIWRERYQDARRRFLSAYEAQREANALENAAQEARSAERQARESLIAEAQAAAHEGDEQALSELRARLASAWAALGQGLPEGELIPLDRRFQQAVQTLHANLERLTKRRQGRRRLAQLSSELAILRASSKPLDQARIRTQIAEGHTLAQGLPDSEAGDFARLVDALTERLHTQHEQAKQGVQSLAAQAEALEGALEAGELKRAEALHQQILGGLELAHLSGLRDGMAAASAARLKGLSQRLKDLQQWRRWGTNQHRTALCEAMEALRSQDLPLAAVAERLHVLQADWRALDPSGAPANRALWNRFHQAREVVYARCRPHLESEAAERAADRAAREAVCQQIEDFLARVDWARIDWRRVLHAEREIRQAWASIGPGDHRQRRPLDRRFHRAIRELDQRLEAERARNQALKQGLIQQVRGLADVADLDAAIEETKGLQRQWHTTVPARQREENRLWQEFRTACDAVFERRAALHQAHRAELEAHLKGREVLCEEAEALLRAPGEARALGAAMGDLEQRWRDAESLPVPRQASSALSRRWQQARESLRERSRALKAAERRHALEQLARHADFCASVEHRVLAPEAAGTGLDEASVRRAWSELGGLADPGLEAAMTARLERTLDALGDRERLASLSAELTPNQEQRRRLCLELEIAAGVESPPELNQERLRLQVQRLAERMAEGELDRLKGVPELLAQWYRSGPAPSDPSLEGRVRSVLAAWSVAPVP